MHLRSEIEDAACVGDVGGWWQHSTATVDPSAVIFPSSYLGPGVVIGRDCVVSPGAVIGAPGFGYEKVSTCGYPNCPGPFSGLGCSAGCGVEQKYRSHTAGVVLEANVHVGANANIAQGRWRPTTLREGCRVDALAHVAHNVIVGRNAMIVAHAELSGSVEVGDGAWVGPHACVRQGLKIGAGAVVGMAACVVTDVPPGETWAGVPARKMESKRAEPEGHPCTSLACGTCDSAPKGRCRSCQADITGGVTVIYCGACDPRA